MSDKSLIHQQLILEKYNSLMGQFCWDKAKELVEKERDSHTSQRGGHHHTSSIVSSMQTALSQLAQADKNYMSLNFLAPKGFLRKEVVKGSYETLRNEFERLEKRGNASQYNCPPSPSNTSSPTSPLSTSSSSILSLATSLMSTASNNTPFVSQPNSPIKEYIDIVDRFASHFCGQLLYYVKARMDMMEIYEKITLISNQKFCVFDEMIKMLSDVVKSNQNQFHHPILAPIKTGFTFECEILWNLFRAQDDIQHWRFLPSLFCLHEAQTKLSSWAAVSINRDSPKKGVLRAPVVPPLYQWLCRLKSNLVSKYSLYFSSILSKQVPSGSSIDMKSICAKQSIDYLQKITSFQRKTDSCSVGILFDTHGEDDYRGPGYHSPFKPFETPKGIDSYPIIFCHPSEPPKNHMPTLIMIMTNKHKELNGSDSVVSFFDHQVQATFFLSRPDPKMTLFIIIESRKSEKDTYILSFVQDICSLLKGNKMFASLKPGVK